MSQACKADLLLLFFVCSVSLRHFCSKQHLHKELKTQDQFSRSRGIPSPGMCTSWGGPTHRGLCLLWGPQFRFSTQLSNNPPKGPFNLKLHLTEGGKEAQRQQFRDGGRLLRLRTKTGRSEPCSMSSRCSCPEYTLKGTVHV